MGTQRWLPNISAKVLRGTKEINPPKGLETAQLFGQRIAQITKQFKK